MNFFLQPRLGNHLVRITPLKIEDFERLYSAGSDPLIWEQHQDKERFRRDRFESYFNGAIDSGSAFLLLNCDETEVLGCSRYYEINPEQKSVAIGYTFLIKKCWGKGYNQAVKDLMITHAFRYVEHIRFYVDSRNTRSQLAIARLGAEKISSVEEKSETGETNIKLIFQLERKSPVF